MGCAVLHGARSGGRAALVWCLRQMFPLCLFVSPSSHLPAQQLKKSAEFRLPGLIVDSEPTITMRGASTLPLAGPPAGTSWGPRLLSTHCGPLLTSDPVVIRGEPPSPLEAEEAELLVAQQPTCSLPGPPLPVGREGPRVSAPPPPNLLSASFSVLAMTC